MRNILFGGVCAAAICAAPAAYGQEITSSIRGQVTAEGAPVAGATVVVTHVPSGTTSTARTGSDGSFGTSGLRVGGPFSVKVSAEGYADTTITDIQLAAGQPFTLPIPLESTGNEIVVTASTIKSIVDTGGGPGTVLNRAAIENVASVSRDIRDIVRRDPFATIDAGRTSRGVMIAGQNARLNKFSIEGLRFSDNFGLNDGGLPTARGPVPLDAIEQLSVKVAPYDIQEGDFQGGAINVVLRSGTNDWTGSAFYTYGSDGLTGSKTRVGPGTPSGRITLDFTSKTYGAFLAGPLIKDKLFLAVAYEKLKEGNPILIGTAGFPQVVPGLTDAQVSQFSADALSLFGYDTLGVQSSTIETDEKWTAKLDWNITDGHRLSATYIKNDSALSSTAGFSSTVPTAPVLGLGSNNYSRPEKVDSYVVQLNSDWSSNFHTEVRANYRKYDLSPVPFGAFPFPQMQVSLDPNAFGTAANSNAQNPTPNIPRLYFGPDQFRHFNYVRTEQYGADIAARAEFGTLSLKVNAAWSHLDIANAFTQNAYGSYYFDSYPDFLARRASTFSYGGSITGDLNDVLASFSYDQYTVGGQVAWDPDTSFNLTGGVRIDTFGGQTDIPVNSYFLARYGFGNNAGINGKIIVQPRLQARWQATPDLQIRAGVGLFAGGSPDVFLGNSYSVSGVFANSFTINRDANGACTTPTPALCSAALDNVTGTIPSVIQDYLRTNTASLALANTNSLDPDYHMSSTWKSSLSVDYTPKFLGGGWNIGGDIYYGWVNWAPLYIDKRLQAVGTTPDGRTRYASLTTGNNTDFFLTNSRKGHSLVAVARIDKSFDFGLSVGGSYSFQDVTDVSPMNGTTASGSYGQNAMLDPNIAAYGTSIYQVRHSWKMHLDYEHAFFGDNKTTFSLFGELRSGLPYSLTMNDPGLVAGHSSVFGASASSSTANRFLLYVPTAGIDPLVSYAASANQTAAQTQQLLSDFIDANGLKRGAVMGKNTQRSPNWFKLDLHVDQEIPLPPEGMKIKVFADVENVLNLLDRDWGSLRQVAFPYNAPVVNVACPTVVNGSCTQYVYSNFTNPAVNNMGKVSLWSVRLGVRVGF